MTPEQEKFLNEIAAELKTQSGFKVREEVFFPLRYDKNRPVIFEHKQIAEELMPKDSRLGKGDYARSIGTTSQNVVQAIVNQYKEEMAKDGVNLDILLNGKKGERGTWREVYNWLWNDKYLRWIGENGWKILQEKANPNPNWIQFETEIQGGNRLPKRQSPPPSAQKVPSTIPANQQLWMKIELEFSNYQLILLNRSAGGQCLLCPSLDFAPNCLIDEPPIYLPQTNSWADENKERFVFEELGQEEFLAIALKKPLNLDWLVPRQEESLPECKGQRLKELFDQLEQQDNWQAFYQSFEVVETA